MSKSPTKSIKAMGTLALYTHYYAIFLIVAVGLGVAGDLMVATHRAPTISGSSSRDRTGSRPVPMWANPAWRAGVWFAAAHLMGAIAFLPWIVNSSGLFTSFVTTTYGRMLLADVLVRGTVSFSLGHGIEPLDPTLLGETYEAMHRLGLILTLPFVASVAIAAMAALGWRWPVPPVLATTVGRLLGWWLLPIVLMVAAVGAKHDFTPRYAVAAVPAFLMVVAVGVVLLWHRRRLAAVLLLMALVGVSGFAIWNGATDPAYGRPDIRSAVRFIEARQGSDSVVVLNAAGSFPTYLFHRQGERPWQGLPATNPPDARATTQRLAELAAAHEEIWLLLWQDYFYDPDALVERWLVANAYPFAQERFHGAIRVRGFRTRPPVVEQVSPEVSVGQRLGDTLELVGYDGGGPIRPGREARVRLYWRVARALRQDYTIFAQLHDAAGQRWAQDDGEPFYGSYPTSRWAPGEIVFDDRTLILPHHLAPGRYTLSVGWYDRATMERVGGASASIPIPVDVAPDLMPLPASAALRRVVFDQRVTLMGMTRSGEYARDQVVDLDLFWRFDGAALPTDKVFVHLVDASGAVRAQHDAPSVGGPHALGALPGGVIVRDRHPLRIPSDLPSGTYRLLVGIYNGVSGERLPVGKDTSHALATVFIR